MTRAPLQRNEMGALRGGHTRGISASLNLHEYYTALNSSFGAENQMDYEQLVVPNGNANQPVHRWFRLKEAFSRRLLPRVLKDTGLSDRTGLTILDPFAGSGTTAISLSDLIVDGSLRRAKFVGYECNPFLHLVASAKLQALQEPTRSFLPLAKKLAAAAARDKVTPRPVPELAAFHNPEFFSTGDLRRLLQLREAIEIERLAGAKDIDIKLLLLCLGASVEPVSSLRRDGRALRFVPDKERSRPIAEFLRRAEWIDEDIPSTSSKLRGSVVQGDGRLLQPRHPINQSVDLALFSPPYPNNIDYSEVYKLEAWLLGFIEDAAAFTDLRRKTLYSHPSILRAGTELALVNSTNKRLQAIAAPLLGAIPADRYEKGRRPMVAGYLLDMATTLDSCFQALRPGGSLVYVVGNSLHGTGPTSFVIAADLLIAEIASSVGFVIDHIDVARQLRRRGVSSSFLRESIVFAHRPPMASGCDSK